MSFCEEKDGDGAVGYSTLPPKSLATAKAKCRTCDQAADAGAHCSSCAAAIEPQALNSVYGGRRKKLPQQ